MSLPNYVNNFNDAILHLDNYPSIEYNNIRYPILGYRFGNHNYTFVPGYWLIPATGNPISLFNQITDIHLENGNYRFVLRDRFNNEIQLYADSFIINNL